MPKELVTLSFGSYASFVSAHYWNIQDEVAGYGSREGWSDYAACIDHTTLFLEMEGRNGISTYRPRAVFFDIAGSSGGVSFSSDVSALPAAAAATSVSTWRSGCEVHRAEPVARSAFLEQLNEHEGLDWEAMGDEEAAQQQAALEAAALQLDPGGGGSGGIGAVGGSRSAAFHWTDFCKVLLGPRSVYCLHGSWTSPYENSLVAGWGAAADLLGSGGGVVEDAVDRVRYMGEACDSLAGFQVLADDMTGFGALAAAVLEEVMEEYGGRPLVLFSLRRPGQLEKQQDGGSAGWPVSTAWATARARDDLSQALSLTRAASLATLYIPVAAPASMANLVYNADLPYHSSAVVACAVDSAFLPTRLTGARSPLGETLGASDLHSLVRLLRPGGGPVAAGLTALHMALPCPSLPTNVQQLQGQLDERVHLPHASRNVAEAQAVASAAAAPAGALRGEFLVDKTAQLSLVEDLSSLTPGITGRGDKGDGVCTRGDSRAESYCLRGGRMDAGPAPTASTLEALDLLLLRQPHRMCVRHRCTAPMPLAVPLPFPQIFRRTVSQNGDVMAGALAAPKLWPSPAATAGLAGAAALLNYPAGVGGRGSEIRFEARSAGENVHSVPVLTRLQATQEFEGWVRRVRDLWVRSSAGIAGRSVLEGWGFGCDDAAEIGSQLDDMAAAFVEKEDI